MAILALAAAGTTTACAHALAGQRLFPSTLNFDDPGIGAELPLVFGHIRNQGVTQNDLDISVTKPITPNFSLTAETDYLGQSAHHMMPAVHGWDNFTFGAVWQVYRDPAAESIGSFSINRTFEHTGSDAVRDNFSTWSPEFDFGQGLGNMHAAWLRPFAATGHLRSSCPPCHRHHGYWTGACRCSTASPTCKIS